MNLLFNTTKGEGHSALETCSKVTLVDLLKVWKQEGLTHSKTKKTEKQKILRMLSNLGSSYGSEYQSYHFGTMIRTKFSENCRQ